MTTRHILLIEDDPASAELTLRAIRFLDPVARTTIVGDGQEAIDYLDRCRHQSPESPPLPDVALLDLKMPKVDGFGVLRHLRASSHFHRVVVVVLTSSKEDKDFIASYQLGAKVCLIKPVDFTEFLEMLRRLWDFLRHLERLGPPRMGADGHG